ncbi:unnamed protein product [Auanema sp. JU1783]|nr:unnamed protein product [Auanema sp. JU1783]
MSDEDPLVNGEKLSSLRVVDLKSELEKRGLSKMGNKSALAERLKEFLLNGQGTPAGTPVKDPAKTPVVENPMVAAYRAKQRALLEGKCPSRSSSTEANSPASSPQKNTSASESPCKQDAIVKEEEVSFRDIKPALVRDDGHSDNDEASKRVFVTESTETDKARNDSDDEEFIIKEGSEGDPNPNVILQKPGVDNTYDHNVEEVGKNSPSVNENSNTEPDESTLEGKPSNSSTSESASPSQSKSNSPGKKSPSPPPREEKPHTIRDNDEELVKPSVNEEPESEPEKSPEPAVQDEPMSDPEPEKKKVPEREPEPEPEREVQPEPVAEPEPEPEQPAVSIPVASEKSGKEKPTKVYKEERADEELELDYGDEVEEDKDKDDQGSNESRTKRESIQAPAQSSDSSSNKPPSRNPVSAILHIRGLVRPFTDRQLKTEICQHGGEIVDFWIDKIKSHCFIKMASSEQANAVREIMHETTWPQSSPKLLSVQFDTDDNMKRHKSGGSDESAGAVSRSTSIDVKDRERHVIGSLPGRNGSLRVTVEAAIRDNQKRDNEIKERQGRETKVRDEEKKRSEKKTDDHENERKRRYSHGSPHRDAVEKKLPRSEKEDVPAKTADSLFMKTKAKPEIYYMPLTEEEV